MTIPARRKLLFAFVLASLPFFLLLAVELSLRFAGVGYSPEFFRRTRISGEEVFVDNPAFNRRFFPASLARIPAPFVMKAVKPANTCRIFVLGESAALGDPRPHFGAVRYLEAMLRERYPDRQFEIVNTAVTAINSHVIRPIARECAEHDGDIWIIYMGNNEMVGPFGAATVFGRKAPSLSSVRATVALQGTRLGQWLTEVAGRFRASATNDGIWRGMEMFVENQVPPASLSRQVVHSSFEKNLADIVRSGVDSGAKVLLSTVVVNLRDCPPFGSLPLDPECAGRASAAQDRRDWPAVLDSLQEAVAKQPLSAEAHFRLGQCYSVLTNDARAAECYAKAMDLDTLPFRADSSINEAILRVGARKGVVICEARTPLATAAAGQVPGHESFYEHVHLNFDGNYRLARAWADHIGRLLPASSNSPPPWLSQAECERTLGLTDWNRISVLQEVLNRCGQPPLSAQANNESRNQSLKSAIVALQERLTADAATNARAVYTEALRKAPTDRYLHEAYAEFLERIGDASVALEERRLVRDLAPHAYFSHYALGTMLKEQKQFAEAEASLRRAVELAPNAPSVRMELGSVLVLLGKTDEALAEFECAERLDPTDGRAYLLKGEVLWKLNRRPQAIAALQSAVSLRPNHPDARYRLGEKLAQTGQIQAAITQFEEAVRLRPDHLKARLNLAIALLNVDRQDAAVPHLYEVLRLDPGNAMALDLKERVERPRAVR